jgi:hypothetical protein
LRSFDSPVLAKLNVSISVVRSWSSTFLKIFRGRRRDRTSGTARLRLSSIPSTLRSPASPGLVRQDRVI